MDASFAVHGDMKSHTGGASSYGRGTFGVKSSKQRLNTLSSTEAELVGVGEYLQSHGVWIQKFMKEQGHALSCHSLYQDNESAMKLECRGRRSSGPRTRHIDIRY